jgi:hypothetical protein
MSAPGSGGWPLFTEVFRQGIDSFIATQKALLDIAVQQNAMFTRAVQESLARTTPPGYLSELSGMMTQAAQAYVDAQQRLLDFARQQSEAMAKAASEPRDPNAPDPLAQLAELSRQGVEAFVETQKQFLDMIARQGASAAGQFKQQATGAAGDFLEQARRGLQNYLDLQRQFVESAARQSSLGTLQGLARQGFEAFINTQKAILDLAFRSMYGTR